MFATTFHALRKKLCCRVSALFLPVALLVMAFAAYFYQTEKEKEIATNSVNERAVVALGKASISSVLEDIGIDLLFIAQHSALKNLLERSTPESVKYFSQDMLYFSEKHAIYDQIRWIDETGLERVRVNFNDGHPSITPKGQLQSKKDRYYFTNTLKLDPGEIYVSPLDLNIEYGKIEIPYKPMLRFGTPVTDSKGRKRGIVMVNYLGDRLISRFNVATSASGGHTMLLDHDGFYLKGLRPEDEWGFMFNRGDLTVARSHPDAWQHISKESKGQFQDADGLWTFDTVYPKSKDKTPSGKEASTEGRAMMQAHAIQWKVVTHLASDRLFAKMEALRERIVAVVILLLGMLLIGSFKLARIDAKHKQAEEEIESLAFYDPLTQLPNRRLLLDRLHQALALSIRTGRQGALLFIDLDNFKSINDTQGHDIGDLLLVEVANRMQSCVREVDTTARLGGDEFVVLLEDLDADEQAAGVHAEAVGEKIRKALGQPYLIKGNVYHSTASIGMTLFRGSVKTTEEMLKRADVALYQAKAEGRNTLRFFDPAMQAAVANRVALESDLRCAISEQEQLRLYYQPQIDSSGRLIGAEALVRWRHPERGMVSPAEFIPLAEESGLILPLGHWVLATACQQLVAWAAHPGTTHLTLAVNVSPKQFRLPTFVEEVLTLIDYFGVTPARLKLEITESLLLDDVDEIITKMGALKARGINFSMDDFGTGHSSLSYLKRLPLYQLKIDKSFVRDVLTDPNDAAIARTIIALAKTMNLAVIAEGVETEAQREFLELNGCHAFQGYLFGKPVPIEQFDALLEQV